MAETLLAEEWLKSFVLSQSWLHIGVARAASEKYPCTGSTRDQLKSGSLGVKSRHQYFIKAHQVMLMCCWRWWPLGEMNWWQRLECLEIRLGGRQPFLHGGRKYFHLSEVGGCGHRELGVMEGGRLVRARADLRGQGWGSGNSNTAELGLGQGSPQEPQHPQQDT